MSNAGRSSNGPVWVEQLAAGLRLQLAPSRRGGRNYAVGGARLDSSMNTELTQQKIAFRLGINQGRVNEVIKRGKWLSDDPASPEAVARDQALRRMANPKAPTKARSNGRRKLVQPAAKARPPRPATAGQLTLGGL